MGSQRVLHPIRLTHITLEPFLAYPGYFPFTTGAPPPLPQAPHLNGGWLPHDYYPFDCSLLFPLGP